MARILIADDDARVRGLLKDILGSTPGTRIIEAENGAMGLSLAHEHKPDLIVLDILMPVMDGIDFLKERSADKELSRIPVIIVSALADRQRVVAAASRGACDYIIKPFDSFGLRLKVAKLLKNALTHHKTFPNAAQSAVRRERPLVLVASGSADVRRLAAEALVGSYEVIEATDGAYCLHVVTKRAPDLVLLSNRIPVLCGKKVVMKIKNTDGADKTRIALLGSAEEIGALDEALASLLIGRVEVPFTAEALLASADRMLERIHYYFYDHEELLVLRFKRGGLEAASAAVEEFDKRLSSELLEMFDVNNRKITVDLRLIDPDETAHLVPIERLLDRIAFQNITARFQVASPKVREKLRAIDIPDDRITIETPKDTDAPQ